MDYRPVVCCVCLLALAGCPSASTPSEETTPAPVPTPWSPVERPVGYLDVVPVETVPGNATIYAINGSVAVESEFVRTAVRVAYPDTPVTRNMSNRQEQRVRTSMPDTYEGTGDWYLRYRDQVFRLERGYYRTLY